METIFQLLGEILDDLSEGRMFNVDWNDGAIQLETNNVRIIDTHIIPLFEDDKVGELLEHCKWYYATITISQDRIIEVGIGDDLDNYVSCDVSTKILQYLTDLVFDDVYMTICQEITKKCEFLVDNDNMM